MATEQLEAQSAELPKMNAFTKVICPELLGKMHVEGTEKMTFAVKANIGCGYPASSATKSLREFVPKDFSPVVRSLVDSGHKIVAMANMHELAGGITAENLVYGDVDNPRKSGYIPGGSSGGSAAAVAMNAVSFALGSDTGGSMRIPAALCGVVGYRPTIGLYDQLALFPLASILDTIGIFSQRVTTVQQVHKTIVPSYTPAKRSLKGVRIGVPRKQHYETLDSEVSRITESALQSLKQAGAELVEVNFAAKLDEDIDVDLTVYEAYRLIPKYLKDQEAPVSFEELVEQIVDPSVKGMLTIAAKISDERYRECTQEVEKIRSHFDNYFETNSLEVFVSPTTILPAVKRPSPQKVEVAGKEIPTLNAFMHNTVHQSHGGVPCISIPSGLSSDGLPVGLEVVAPRGMDGNLLDLAAAIQSVLPPLPQLKFDDFKDRL